MYEQFFSMKNTPFTRDIPADRLYTSPKLEDAIGSFLYTINSSRA